MKKLFLILIMLIPFNLMAQEAPKLNKSGGVDAYITGPIDNESLTKTVIQIFNGLRIGATRVDLQIESHGGRVDDGFKFIELMDALKRRNISFVCYGKGVVASMAFIIFTNCNQRFMLPGSVYMTHYPIIAIPPMMPNMVIFKISDLEYILGELKKSRDKATSIMRKTFLVSDELWENLNENESMMASTYIKRVSPTFADCVDSTRTKRAQCVAPKNGDRQE